MTHRDIKRKKVENTLNENYEYQMHRNNFIYNIPTTVGIRKRNVENIENNYMMTAETAKNCMRRVIELGKNNKLFINCVIAVTAGVAMLYNIRVDEIQYVSKALIDLANIICAVGCLSGVTIESVFYNKMSEDKLINVAVEFFKVTGFWGLIYLVLRAIISVFLV